MEPLQASVWRRWRNPAFIIEQRYSTYFLTRRAMNPSEWSSDDIAADRPNVARIYDYLLGGYHNFEIDRRVAEKVISDFPDVRLTAPANRAFLGRAVRFLVSQGIDQFLDIGSGLPTVGNVHEIAQAATPHAHVVYVDIDPIAVAHSQAILAGNPNAAAIRGDVHLPHEILDHPKVKQLLDFRRPCAVLLVAVLHLVADDADMYNIVSTLRQALSPESYIVIAHTTDDGKSGLAYREMIEKNQTKNTILRTRSQILRLFEGLELVEPGLVYIPLWRPEGPNDILLDDPERSINYAGVGYKPKQI
jgi:hypothetical protein